ncbi:hypothetical protein C5S53_16805 [Methanophagales archaeon]|nr:hypothetical protein C5S53_16805 [Methanophagales archaeon]
MIFDAVRTQSYSLYTRTNSLSSFIMLLGLSQIFKNCRYTDWILTKYANGPNRLYSAGLASSGGI